MVRVRQNREEDAIQSEIVGLLEVAAIDGLIWFSVPNGGFRDWRTAQALNATGQKAGVADLVLCHAALGTAFLEMKRPGGRQSKAQIKFQAECEAKSFAYAIARSRNEAQDILTRWGFLRGAGAAHE